MAYDDVESSIESGSPVELYQFAVATGTTYYFCSGSDTITFSGHDYTPIAIVREAIPIDSKARMEMLKVSIPGTHALAQLYANLVPAFPTKASIFRLHRTDSSNTVINLYSGVVRAVSFDEKEGKADIGIMPVSGRFSRNLPRYTYQSLCGNILYDRWCKVDKTAFNVVGVVGPMTSAVQFTVAGLSAEPDQWSNSGYVIYNGDYRLITDQTGGVVTIITPFTVDINTQTVTVYAGCDHSQTACNLKFSNGTNYRGFPQVPRRNPFTSGV